jgi:signal transduction histidine kinase
VVGSLTFIRSLALIDASGLIEMSSRVQEQGQTVSMQAIGVLPINEAPVLSRLIPVRYLEDMSVEHRQPSDTLKVFSLPLIRRVQAQDGRVLYLVALLNPDFFANFQAVTLGDSDLSAVLTSYAGDVIASYPQVLPLGTRLDGHLEIVEQLKPRAQGTYIGPGAGDGEQIVSVRTSRAWPLVTLVERPMSAAWNDWYRLLSWFVLVGALALVVIAVMARLAWRSAQDAARTKAEFIANISHELRTPLQSILGFSELGLMRTQDQTRLSGMFNDIHTSGQRMLTLVNDLLDISKIDSAFSQANFSKIDARQLVRDVESELAPLLRARLVTFDARLPANPVILHADILRIHQVLRNVIANALKFSSPGQKIIVGASVPLPEILHFYVQDEGCGIPQNELENIFEPFVQSTLTKDGSGGTGLGLAICRRIVQAHGGKIHAENIPGGGAVFHIELPLSVKTRSP